MPNPHQEPGAFCALCDPPRRVGAEHLFEHLRVVHGEEPKLATWPDGELVIVDETLQPDDFNARGGDDPQPPPV
jgi:hypothetical protein